MAQRLRIAVVIDLDWPLKRHHEVYSGIQAYGKTHAPRWDLVADLFPATWIEPADGLPAYDAVIGRVSKKDHEAAKRTGIPMVNVWWNSPARPDVPSVLVDYTEAGRMAATHLLSRGLRRLAVVGHRPDVITQAFFDGVKSVAKEQDVPVSRHTISFTHTRDEKRWRRFVRDANQWLDSWSLPIGVAASYDQSLRFLATMCQRRGIQIPEELAMIGCGDEPIHCEGSEPELSSIDNGFYRAGFAAAELLDHLLRGGDAPTEPVLTPPADLVPRLSTDVYAVADKTVGRAMRYIAEHCGEPIRVDHVAEHVGCGRRKLERQFRDAGRRSINEEIVALRLELTKRLLVDSTGPVEDIAAQAGFGTAQHMRHVFRSRLGMSPTAYRAKHGK